MSYNFKVLLCKLSHLINIKVYWKQVDWSHLSYFFVTIVSKTMLVATNDSRLLPGYHMHQDPQVNNGAKS